MASKKQLGELFIDLTTNTAEIKKGLKETKSEVNQFTSQVNTILKGLSFAGVLYGLKKVGTGIKDLVADTVDLADQTIKMSQRYGVSVEQMSSFRYEAELSGISTQTLATGIKNLARNVFDASRNVGDAKDIFKKWKIPLKDANGELRDIDKILIEVADHINNLGSETEQLAVMQRIFGRSGAEMLTYVKAGSEGIQEMRQEFELTGAVISTDMGINAAKFNDNMTAIKYSLQAVTLSIVDDFLPSLVSISQGLKEFIFWAKQSDDWAAKAIRRFDALAVGISVLPPVVRDLVKLVRDLISLGVNKEIAKTETGITDLVDATKRAIFTDEEYAAIQTQLTEKIAGVKNQITALFNPTKSARDALERFIQKVTKGEIGEFSEEISELRTEFEELQRLTETQKRVAYEVTANVKRIAVETQNAIEKVKDSYREGEGALTQYYAQQKQIIEDGYKKEIEQLKILRDTRLNQDEKAKVSQQIVEKETELRKKLTEVLKDEDRTRDKLKDVIATLEDPGAVSKIASEETVAEIREYYDGLRDEVELWSDENLKVQEEFYDKSKLLAQINAQETMAIEEASFRQSLDLQRQKLENAAFIVSSLGNIFSQAYSLMGKSGEAFFYFQKAMAIAQVAINTAIAVTKVLAAHADNPAAAAGMVAFIKAIGIAQMAIIAAQAIQGPPKMHEGGLIKKTGVKSDEVDIRAKVNEYLLRDKAVSHYGLAAMTALNNMLIPKDRLYGKGLESTVGGGSSYTLNIPIHVDDMSLGQRLRGEIEATTIRVMREYAN